MTVEIARAGRRDDRAPRTPAASVDRRVASPWTDAPGPSSPAGSFRAPGAASATTMWSPSDERGRPTSPPRAGAAAPPSGNVFTHEEKHAQAVRAGEARRASSSTARETILDAVRQMMERRALERERDGRDPPPVDDDDDDDDDIVKLRTSRGSCSPSNRSASGAGGPSPRRSPSVGAGNNDAIHLVVRGGGWRETRPRHGSRARPGYVRRRRRAPPACAALGRGVHAPTERIRAARARPRRRRRVAKRRNDEEDEKGRAVGRGDAREAWETAADEREQPARATLERKKRLPYVTARRPADDASPDPAPETSSERERRVESAKEQKRRAAADERARSATFVARAVSVVSAFSPFKKAASSVGAYKESAEDVAQLEELSRGGGRREDHASDYSGAERRLGRARGPATEGEGGERAPRDEARGRRRGATRTRGRGAQGEGRGGRQGDRRAARVSNHEGLEVLEGGD